MGPAGLLPAALELCDRHRMLPPGTTVLCALSGGADSVCLLHWLYTLSRTRPLTLVAAHYDHNLRPGESRSDAVFVEQLVARYFPGVPLISGSGQVALEAAQSGRGIEETARDMRYAFLQQAALQAGAQVIATAHNANDNAETMLLNLMRGCGLNGLAGIPPRRDNIVRPLLTTTRQQIEDYLSAQALPHVEDSSNLDERYARNRVRRRLIPALEELCPDFVSQAADTCGRLADDEALLADQAQAAVRTACLIPHGLSLPAGDIARLPDPLAVRGVRALLTRLRSTAANCTAAHLHAVVALCRSASPSARVDLPCGVQARRVYDRLELVCPDPVSAFEPAVLTLPGQLSLAAGTLTVRADTARETAPGPYTFALCRTRIPQQLTLRPRRTGDTLTRPGRCRATVKKLMIDDKLPRHLRDLLPVLEQDGRIAAVVGLGPDQTFVPAPGQPCWYVSFTPANTERNDDP